MTENGGVRYRAAKKQHEAGVGDYQLEPAAVFGLAPHLVIPRGRLLGDQAASHEAFDGPCGGGENDELGIGELGHGGLLRIRAPPATRRSHHPHPPRVPGRGGRLG